MYFISNDYIWDVEICDIVNKRNRTLDQDETFNYLSRNISNNRYNYAQVKLPNKEYQAVRLLTSVNGAVCSGRAEEL
jgi:hypothetical protein